MDGLEVLNHINIIPTLIEVDGSQLWKEKDMSKVKDLTKLERLFDWSYSTPYKGTLIPQFSKSQYFTQLTLTMPPVQ